MKKKIIFIGTGILAFILCLVFLIPVINKEIELRGIRHNIQNLEKANTHLDREIATLGVERTKCEVIQGSGHAQAQGIRSEQEQNDLKIEELKLQYNSIAGFTQAGQ